MYIYADETGNTGKDIFSPPALYGEGAIFAVEDIEPIVGPILVDLMRDMGVSRIHANELQPWKAAEIATSLLDALDASAVWDFHLTLIEKEYLATTKFVDTVFDSGENRGARWLWYNVAYFRHVLCLLIDKMLTPRNRRAFWWAYLNDDYDGVKAAVRNARTYLDRFAKDRRLINVVLDAFDFALRYPEEITLMASKRRDSYKGHTPNMVAFSSVMQGAHDFAETHHCMPVAFYHDHQSEFGKTMHEYASLFSRLRIEQPEVTRPWLPSDAKITDYELGKFSMPSSKDSLPLQAVDILLWIVQRDGDPTLATVRERILDRIDPFCISRAISEMVRMAGLKRLAETPISDEKLVRGQEIASEMEEHFQEKRRDFFRGSGYSKSHPV